MELDIIDNEFNRSNAHYRDLLRSITNYIYTVKVKDGRAVSTHHTPTCEAVTGYTADEYKADPYLWFRMIHEEDRDKLIDQIDKLLAGETVVPIEHRIYHKDKTLRWIRLTLVPLHDENGKITEYDGLIENITERKKAEEALLLSERKYRRIFENTQDVYYEVDLAGKIIDVSPSVVRYSGYKREELIGMNIETLYLYPDERVILLSIIFEKRELVDYELELKKKDGSVIYTSLNSHLIFGSDGRPVGLEGSIRDISERKLSEARIKKLNQAVEQSPTCIVITDIEGMIEYVNPRFTRLTGYTPDEVIGKRARILKQDKLEPEVFTGLWLDITKGRVWNGEFFNKKKNGEPFWESVMISPITNEKGEAANFIIITEDITEKKNFLEQQIEAKEKAEKSDQLKSEFLAQMSHEIRTPVNAIMSFSRMLDEEINIQSPRLREFSDAIDVSCARMIRTIDMILDMSEIHTGNYEPQFKLTNLTEEILSKVFEQYRGKACKKNLEFVIKSRAKNIFILGDQYSLEQIFFNLVDNAIAYTPEGKIEIDSYLNRDGNPCVSITDTGIGISKSFLPDLFQPFRQEEQGYTRRYEGNGLGLALVKKYCEINNAEITVKSTKGSGSKFTVKFNQTLAI
jgi:PAS domain S-box-containing protein